MQALVKICGTTNLDDALCAVEAGADALGFVFAKSPRQVEPEQVKEITSQLPSHVLSVGVFVNGSLRTILTTVAASGVKAVQLHGDEPPEAVEEISQHMPTYEKETAGWPLLVKVFAPRQESDLEILEKYTAAQAFLIDAHVEGVRGGTGKRADWGLAKAAKKYGRVILAGGLSPENIGEALSQVDPFGVDIISGVEAAPGKKDPVKVREFVRLVRGI
ncbi:MAG: N-(5'-phosphoribosyl)anthranilate isomerase [Armatimonadetes bacterium]|nr:N-(5'-phosphoribosyl)anthranilate isomerase [Armatimonadota bacterium]NIO76168.1 N-(5'-phosphoribosyl)anthranilate isomerase [Armatimonadota bacterium]NIO98864.1 N-(5'-phosphoribosyl)anthranilate isomerase [Armatimonadota bacterium]